MKRNSNQPSLFNFGVKKIKNNEETENESSNIENIATEVDVPNALQTQLDTNIDNESLRNYSLDIGLFLLASNNINDAKKYELLKNPWTPPKNYQFPIEQQRRLKFQLDWLNRFPWLVYSEKVQGALCKCCVLFANNSVGKGVHQKLGVLIIKPFTKWKDAIERFNRHSSSEYHKLSIIRSEEFIKVMENKKNTIANEIDTSRKKQVIENRSILRPIIETLIVCGKQNIALRGNNDSGKIYNESIETNDGNFRSLLRFKSLTDPILDKHLKNATTFASYTSPNVQNEIITICGNLIQENILKNIRNAKYFSILVDETQDVSRLEQMSFCVRYVDGVSNCIMEDFLEFSIVHDMTGKGLSTSILQLLEKFGLEKKFLVGQGYDGAASMSGQFNGVQQYIRGKI